MMSGEIYLLGIEPSMNIHVLYDEKALMKLWMSRLAV